jgi:arylsulfatase A-like enzyme
MNRFIPLVLVASTFLTPAAAHAQAKRPNIVFILADDLGWTDVACCGKTYLHTPNIDRLAKQGLRFTSGYTCGPNCAPTRAALMSGLYGPRTGVFTVGTSARGQAAQRKIIPVENNTKLPLDVPTVAQSLKSLGYATAIFGKWHLGEDARHHPSKRGFDEAVVTMGRHFEFKTNPPVPVAKDAYLADFLTDLAVRFIEKNRDRPFFLYLPHFAVHTPHQAKAELVAKYRKMTGPGAPPDPVYAAMIESVDDSVGRVVAKLAELGLAENTIVIFSSDNGGVGAGNNRPLRGAKGMLYEGGVRVPLIVRWAGVTPAGKTCDEPVISVDFFPTFVELAGGRAGPKLDGVSFVPLLRDPSAHLARDALYWHFPCYLEGKGKKTWRTTPAGSIRVGDWKLIEFFEDGKTELYNLRDDLGQKTDLAAKRPEKTRELQDKLKAWRRAVKAPMPTPKTASVPGAVPKDAIAVIAPVLMPRPLGSRPRP